MIDNVLNYDQIADYLGYSKSTIQHWVSIGYIPNLKFGNGKNGGVRFKREIIDNWLKEKEVEGRKEVRLDVN